MIIVKLSAANYLYWKNHITLVLVVHDLLAHVDGSTEPPAKETVADGKSSLNPLYAPWFLAEQKTRLILNASLSEEAIGEVVHCQTAREAWLALEQAYGNTSIERVQNLKDELRQMVKGTSSVAEYGRRFRLVCDQLLAAGYTIDDHDKLHWFLRGLGSAFENFSTTARATKPPPSLRDLITQAEGHEMFVRSLPGTKSPPIAAFNSQSNRFAGDSTNRGRGGRPCRG
jgi:hypothetical protein